MTGRRSGMQDDIGKLIKKEIVASGPEGITQKVLCDALNIPRMTASRHCKRLAADRKIRVIREGTGARYVAKSKIVMDPEIGAYVQGRRAYFNLIRRGRPVLINSERIAVELGKVTDLEVALFCFSSIAGALFSYVMIQAMSHSNPILQKEYHRKAPYYMNKSRKDRLVRQWIDGFFSGLLVFAPYKLKELLYRYTGRYPTNFQGRKSFHKKNSGLSIKDLDIVEQAFRAFENIYPSIFRTLNRISHDLPKSVDYMKRSLDSFEKSSSPSLHEIFAEEKKRENKVNAQSKKTGARSLK
jgi:hypothetical protein